ncbi:MAG: thioredoxin domain-containing protein, partial [Bacteroidota bacterium]
YDQAQLIHSFLDAYQITHDEFFAQVARETLEYALREMTSPAGGFYSAEDADSTDTNNPAHKTEGAFYVWEKSDIVRLVTAEEASVFCYFYAVEENGNALADPLGEFRMKNILYSPFTIEQTGEHFKKSPEEITSLLLSAKKKLLTARTNRPRPQLDDKVLTSWNGLMIGACARASRVLGNADYYTAALKAAEFIRRHLYDTETKSLMRRFREGEAKFEAHLDDYAFLVSGILDLYDATFDYRWIEFAADLSGTMIALFWDSAEGGFYDTSGKDPSVLVRMKEAYDGAEPTGNSIAATALLRLYELTGETSFKTYSEKTIKYFSTMLIQSPQVMPQMMCALDRFISPPEHLVFVHSEKNAGALLPLVEEVYGNFHPHLNVIGVHERSKDFFTARHPFMKGMEQIGGEATSYYCRDYSCLMPAVSAGELHDQMKKVPD